MDIPFNYNKPVTGRWFIGRKAECALLSNFLRNGENIVMYEPPKAVQSRYFRGGAQKGFSAPSRPSEAGSGR